MSKKVILSLILFLIFLSYGWGQSGSRVSVTINPDVLIVGEAFTLTFLVDYPVPEDVSLIAPPFSASLTVDRFLRIPRASSAISDTGAGQIQTSMEFRLIPKTSGRIILNSFSVITPAGITEINAIVLEIRNEKEEQIFTHSLRWEGAALRITAGERVTFSLLIQTRNENILSIPPAFFMPEVPKGVILSQSQINIQERERGIVLKLTLIPLSGGEFILPARILQQENVRFEIPELRIFVSNR